MSEWAPTNHRPTAARTEDEARDSQYDAICELARSFVCIDGTPGARVALRFVMAGLQMMRECGADRDAVAYVVNKWHDKREAIERRPTAEA